MRPAGQAVQDDDPLDAVLYEPIAQAVQLVALELLDGWKYPFAQVLHVGARVPAPADKYRPALHVVEYVQVVPSAVVKLQLPPVTLAQF